jgi:cation diffusion facilitator family transporter
MSNTLLVLLKLAAGIATGSIAVISEAVHSCLDLLAAFITFVAGRISGAPPDHEHPFGHGKAENLAALFEAVLIIAGGLYIVRESVEGLVEGRGLDSPGLGVAVMFVSSLVNLLVSRHLFKTGRKFGSPALVTDAWHLMTDVFTSLGIFIALLAIHVGRLIDPSLDLGFIDPVAAMAVSFFIIKTGWTLAKEAVSNLVDHSLPDEDIRFIIDSIRRRGPGIKGYRRLRTRRSGPYRTVVVDLLVDGSMSVSAAHALGVEVSRSLSGHFPGADVFFHLEPVWHPGHDGEDGGEGDGASTGPGLAPDGSEAGADSASSKAGPEKHSDHGDHSGRANRTNRPSHADPSLAGSMEGDGVTGSLAETGGPYLPLDLPRDGKP